MEFLKRATLTGERNREVYFRLIEDVKWKWSLSQSNENALRFPFNLDHLNKFINQCHCQNAQNGNANVLIFSSLPCSPS